MEFSTYDTRGDRNRSARHRVPLGLLMLSKGLISSDGMQEALRAQRESQKGRFGAWLVQLGVVTEAQLTAALGMQWGCPVFHLSEDPDFESSAYMVPLGIMESSRMAPVYFMSGSRTLYVAFSDGIDFPILRAIEQMLDCSTQPCVISESEMAAAHDAIRRMDRPSEMVLECPRDLRELARSPRLDGIQSGEAGVRRSVSEVRLGENRNQSNTWPSAISLRRKSVARLPCGSAVKFVRQGRFRQLSVPKGCLCGEAPYTRLLHSLVRRLMSASGTMQLLQLRKST